MASDNYLTTKQTAQLSGLSMSYLNKLRCLGGGSPFLKVGRKCIYRRDEFEAWLAKHQRGSTSEYSGDGIKSRPHAVAAATKPNDSGCKT
jgi:hypothetical protein